MRMPVDAARRGVRLALAAGVVAAGVTFLAPAAQAASVRVDRVEYECQALNPVVNSSLQGHYQFFVTAETTLPDVVQAGSTVPATSTTLTLTLSSSLVTHLHDSAMKVERVKGTSTSDVWLQAVFPDGQSVDIAEPVDGLAAPDWVPLTPGSEVDIPATGTVAALDVPDNASDGLIYVMMPKVFTLDSEMDPPVLGRIAETELRCAREDESDVAIGSATDRVIGTIPIGDGCSQSECPLQASQPGQNPGGGDGGTPGSGTDPEVINPTVPDDEVALDDEDYGWEDDDEDADGRVAAVSAETTELPATGSGVGVGLGGAFGALIALRLALAARSRRPRA